jgi:peptidoglycan/xylan/chitin deacetylase (PgdA/CDA1 family)
MKHLKFISFILLLCLAIMFGLWQLSRSTSFQLFGDVIARVETNEPVIALTFDDGPGPKYLAPVLELLEKENVTATFFLVGQAVRDHPDLTQDIAARGHEIANHSFTHPRMVLMSMDRIAQEIEDTDAAIRATGYVEPLHFRPPYGKKLVNLPRYLAEHDRASIMWDIAPEKWNGSVEEIANRIAEEAKPGSIVLFHVMYDSGGMSRAVLPLAIKTLKAKGYRFVTVSQLLEQKGV